MKFLRPQSGQTMDLFRMLAQNEEYKLSDPESTGKFINQLSEEFTKARSNPIMLHGFRSQAMFEYVASSLGKCAIVKTEDAGSLHAADMDIKVPDLRILLTNGEEFLVEVKNFHQRSPFASFKIKRAYIDGLQRYASLFRKEVKLAVYWSRWNQWTLITFDKVKCDGSKCALSFEDAMKFNEMATLGDFIIGTVPPLTFRVITDPAHPRVINESGEAAFRIKAVELYCGDKRIQDPKEQNIAFFLMLYGEWDTDDGKAYIENNEIIYLDYTSQPVEPDEDQNFEMIGNMSGMISRRFNSMTSNEGNVERISPQTDISDLGIQIPSDYHGEILHLWRFIQQPATE